MIVYVKNTWEVKIIFQARNKFVKIFWCYGAYGNEYEALKHWYAITISIWLWKMCQMEQVISKWHEQREITPS